VLALTLEAEVNEATFVTVVSPLELTLVALLFVELAPVSWLEDVVLTLVVPLVPTVAPLFAALLIVLPDDTPPVDTWPAVVF